MKATLTAWLVLLGCGCLPPGSALLAAERAAPAAIPAPALALKVQWRYPPEQGPLTDAKRRVTQAAVATPGLELTLYGPCKDGEHGRVEVYGAPGSTFPMNVWTGMCPSPVAITVRSRSSLLDLSGPAKIRWITRTGNLHAVRPVLRLADGSLMVGDHSAVTPTAPGQGEAQMVQTEFAIGPVKWFALDPDTLSVGKAVDNPDLSRVDAVGAVDLMPGNGHGPGGWINVGEIEVYGKTIAR
jgi:hypothetical protein